MVLNPVSKVTKYWNVYGMQDDWKTVSTTLAGNLGVFSDINSTLAASPSWSIHIDSCKEHNHNQCTGDDYDGVERELYV